MRQRRLTLDSALLAAQLLSRRHIVTDADIYVPLLQELLIPPVFFAPAVETDEVGVLGRRYRNGEDRVGDRRFFANGWLLRTIVDDHEDGVGLALLRGLPEDSDFFSGGGLATVEFKKGLAVVMRGPLGEDVISSTNGGLYSSYEMDILYNTERERAKKSVTEKYESHLRAGIEEKIVSDLAGLLHRNGIGSTELS